jgi:hypothetical protein
MSSRLIKTESGLRFDLDGARALDGDLWMANVSGHGAKSCDFVVARESDVWFVEAKSSAPSPASPGTGTGPSRLETWCADVCEKLLHTATTILAKEGQRQPSLPDIPEPLATAFRAGTDWVFVVVIARHEAAWLGPVRDQLRNTIRKHPAWRLLGVTLEPKVLNRKLATQLGLVRDDTTQSVA